MSRWRPLVESSLLHPTGPRNLGRVPTGPLPVGRACLRILSLLKRTNIGVYALCTGSLGTLWFLYIYWIFSHSIGGEMAGYTIGRDPLFEILLNQLH